MAGQKLTFVAEFVDRLTGPTKKAQKAVEDLGKAADDAAKKSKQSNDRAGRAEEKRARATEQSARLAERSESRRAKAAEDSSRRSQRAAQDTEKAEKRRTTTTQKASAQQDKAFSASTIAAERAARNHKQASDRVNRALGSNGSSANRSARAMQQMAGTATTSANRTASVINQMAGRSADGVNRLGKSMDRLKPDRMASRYNTALNRMLGRTEQVAGQIRSSLQKVTDTDFVNYGAMGATAVGGMAAVGGFKRIADTQQADVVMQTMGIDDRNREQLMGQFKGLAQDTPFSTGSIASLGSGLIASGMDQSKVENSLQGAIDTAALFGMSMEEIALPLKQMQAKGVLQGDDLNQLMDRNIPVMDWIAKQKGVDRSEVKEMVSRGEVSADDMFAAMAANSAGGAEKASGTLKGSWTNFLSSISQGGEAFLVPMVDDLTEALQIAKESVAGMKPQLTVLGKFVGTLVKGLAPFLPVIVPGLVGLGAALVTLKVASTAAAGIQALSQGAQWLSQRMGGSRGAAAGMGLFGRETRYAQSDVKTLAGQGGLGGMNERLRDSTKNMGRAERAAFGLGKAIGGISIAAMGLSAVGAGLDVLINNKAADLSGAENAIKGGDLGGVDRAIAEADWNNKNPVQRALEGGARGKAGNVGEMLAMQENRSGVQKANDWLNSKFMHTRNEATDETISGLDSKLAGMAGTPEAGSAFNQWVFQAEGKGMSQEAAMAKFPQYKQAVYDVFTERGQRVGDNEVLQAMRSSTGFRSGGWTGNGPANAVAGVVHGREYVVPEPVTKRPGVLPALREIHRTGEVPRSYHGGSTTQVSVNVDARGATPDGAAAVGQSVEQAVERVLARRERRGANQHGNRALRGAH